MKNKRLLKIGIIASCLILPFLSGCEKQDNTFKTIDLYALNDVHGRINEHYISANHYEPGLARINTYLKQLKAESSNFIMLNSGDMYQDTYDSAMNYGSLMAETMPLMETEAMAIGNHEFDWGIENFKNAKNLAGSTTYLGANIYHYDPISKKPTSFASELGEKYKIIERDGLKIGVIGVIGRDQITSILSTIVDNYVFLEPTKIIKDLSDELRVEKGCDAVVVCAHADQNQLDEQSDYAFSNELTSTSNVSKRRYVDAVFTAHTHKNQNDVYHDVPFIQSGCHGEEIGHIQLQVNHSEVKFITSESLEVPSNLEPDPAIQSVIDRYLTPQFMENKHRVIGHIADSNFISRKNSGKMLAWMTYENIMQQTDLPFENLDIVFNNGGRSSINIGNGDLTRGVIFDALPFTNKTYVAEIKGYDIIKEAFEYEYPYYAPKALIIDPNKTYTIAVIDYLLFHKDSNKSFNYFKSFTGETLYCESRHAVDLIENYFTSISKSSTLSKQEAFYKPEYNNVSR